MTKEQIERFDKLRADYYENERRIGWAEMWGKELYDGGKDDRFLVTISKRFNGKAVFQRDISREDVECEYQAEMAKLLAERERIEKEIELI